MNEDKFSLVEILSDRDFPFSIIVLIFTSPINLIYFFGMIVFSIFNYDTFMNLIPFPFVLMNFMISVWFFFFGFINREFDTGCF